MTEYDQFVAAKRRKEVATGHSLVNSISTYSTFSARLFRGLFVAAVLRFLLIPGLAKP